MTNLDNHYKDRKPEETVQIIKDFFNDRGFRIEELNLKETNCGTWGCELTLYYNNIAVGSSNGKGMTKEFAQASGHAELYERFCSKMHFTTNPFLLEDYYPLAKENQGYYFHPDEIETTYDNILNWDLINTYYHWIFRKDEVYLKKYIDYLTCGKYIQIPVENIITGERAKDFINPVLLTRTTGSNGMCAGNTKIEAINQGLAELYERHCMITLIKNPDIVLHKLNPDTLNNEGLKAIISKIKEAGNSLSIFDLSYNFNYPVVGGIITNHKNKTCTTVLGSFPVFDIALERVLTEMYQNRFSYNKWKGTTSLINPMRIVDTQTVVDNFILGIYQDIPMEPMLLNFIEVDDYNREQYLETKSYTNEDIYEWNKKKCIEHNLNIYMIDNSLSDKIFSLQLFCPDLEQLFIDSQYDTAEKIKHFSLDFAMLIQKLTKRYANNDDRYGFIIEFMEMYKKILTLPEDERERTLSTTMIYQCGHKQIIAMPFGSFGYIYFNRKLFLSFLMEIYERATKRLDTFQNFITNDRNPFAEDMLKYLTLWKYTSTDKYTNEEIKIIMDNFGIEISEEDWKNCNDPLYILYNIYFKYIKQYNKEDLAKILEGYIK